jgi:hypothetical protein
MIATAIRLDRLDTIRAIEPLAEKALWPEPISFSRINQKCRPPHQEQAE